MRMLLDEVFGPGNFVAEIAWERRGDRDNRSIFSGVLDSILVYTRSAPDSWRKARNLLPREDTSAYINPDNDPRGRWMPDNFTAQFNPSENPRESQLYTLTTPAGKTYDVSGSRCWLVTEPRYRELVADNRVWFGTKGDGRPSIKRFLSEVQDGLVPKTLWSTGEVGTNSGAKKEIQALFPDEHPFATPKPERLLERIIHIATNPGDIVLDVFAGSGTTAAVAHKMGRRWVTAELSESNFTSFTVPRLTKVVNGTDPGGITTTKGSREDATEDGLPEGLTPEEAQRLTSLLNKAIRNRDDLKKDSTLRAVKKMVKTVAGKDTVNWLGGGSFHVARVAPSVIDYYEDLDLILMADEVSHEALVGAVSANLGYTLTPDDPHFDGFFGRTLLVVVKGLLNTPVVDNILPHIPEGHSVALAAIATPP